MTAIEKNYILLSTKCATNESRVPANDNIRQIVQNNSSKVCEWDCVVRRLRRWTLDKCCWHWGRTELPGSDKKYKAGYCTVRRIRWAAQGRRSHIWTQCITNQLTKKCKSIKTNVRCTTSKTDHRYFRHWQEMFQTSVCVIYATSLVNYATGLNVRNTDTGAKHTCSII